MLSPSLPIIDRFFHNQTNIYSASLKSFWPRFPRDNFSRSIELKIAQNLFAQELH